MSKPRIICSSPGWTTASCFWVCVQPLQPSQTSPVLQPLPLTATLRGQKPRRRMQWRLGKPKSKASVPSGAFMCPRLCYRCGISSPCWTNTTSAAAPCKGTHFQHDWNPTQSGQKNWNPFLPLKCNTLLIKLGKTHQTPKRKGMLCKLLANYHNFLHL